MEMASKVFLNYIFERNLKRWTVLFSFMNKSFQRALNASRFERPVGKYICRILRILTNQVEKTEQKERMVDNFWTLS